MKVIFFGTPQFAVPSLKRLVESHHDVLMVITQPDRAKNRKGQFVFSPIKTAALELGIGLMQFESIRAQGDQLRKANADIFVTAGYGQLFSQEIISIAPKGIINVHASLLPSYRGSSPIQWAIINGETTTGVTIMQTDIGLDTGDILQARQCPIYSEDTTATLTQRLSVLGADLLIETLDKIEDGTALPTKQDHSRATKFPMISKQTGWLDFCKEAQALKNLIRAIECHTLIDGQYVKILSATVVHGKCKLNAGQVCSTAEGICVCCGKDMLNITTLQPQNKRPMSAKEYLLGHKLDLGTTIGK